MSHHEDGENTADLLYSSLLSSASGHAVLGSGAVSRMPEAQILFKQDVSIVNLNKCLLIAIKGKLLIFVRDQSAIVSQISVTGHVRFVQSYLLEILWLQVENEGAVSIVLLTVRNHTNTNETHRLLRLVLTERLRHGGPNQKESLPLPEGLCEVCLENVFVTLQSECWFVVLQKQIGFPEGTLPAGRLPVHCSVSVFGPSSPSLYWVCPTAQGIQMDVL